MSTMHDACGGTKPRYTGCKSVEMKEIEEKAALSKQRGEPRFDGVYLPHMSSQSLQSHPSGPRDVLLGELPDKGPRDHLLLQEQTVGTNHHTLLTPREHDVRPSLVLHEPRARSSDDRNNDVVCFVALEGVHVEYCVLPRESCSFESILDRVPLSVVRSDNLEFFSFLEISLGHFDGDFHFSFVLSNQTSVTNGQSES
jgi:hypothetical protein